MKKLKTEIVYSIGAEEKCMVEDFFRRQGYEITDHHPDYVYVYGPEWHNPPGGPVAEIHHVKDDHYEFIVRSDLDKELLESEFLRLDDNIPYRRN